MNRRDFLKKSTAAAAIVAAAPQVLKPEKPETINGHISYEDLSSDGDLFTPETEFGGGDTFDGDDLTAAYQSQRRVRISMWKAGVKDAPVWRFDGRVVDLVTTWEDEIPYAVESFALADIGGSIVRSIHFLDMPHGLTFERIHRTNLHPHHLWHIEVHFIPTVYLTRELVDDANVIRKILDGTFGGRKL